MALPISLSMLVPQINFITNNIFLGALGERELASAGITGVYYLIFAVIGHGLNNGLQALVARRAGQNLPKEIGKLFFNGVWVALGIAALGIGATYLLAPWVMRSFVHDAAIANQVIDFLLIRIWGLPFLYLFVMRNALLVGTNQTRFLVWGTLAEAVVNIFLDYSLIYGHFGFSAIGFNGAAYASIVAEASGLIVIYAVIHYKGIHKSFAFFEQTKIDFSIVKLILLMSAPLIVQFAISIISCEYFYILIEHHGPPRIGHLQHHAKHFWAFRNILLGVCLHHQHDGEQRDRSGQAGRSNAIDQTRGNVELGHIPVYVCDFKCCAPIFLVIL